MRKQEGFSLIELLIVVAIILIIAAIAIPNLLRARMAANESSAVASIRTITTAEVTYQMAYPTVGFATALSNLGNGTTPGGACTPSSGTACLIDGVLGANGNPSNSGKSGYMFGAAGTNTAGGVYAGYVTATNPITENQTGIRAFCAVEDGVVRVDPTGAAVTHAANSDATCNVLAPLNQ